MTFKTLVAIKVHYSKKNPVFLKNLCSLPLRKERHLGWYWGE